jgi:hypothetical protein
MEPCAKKIKILFHPELITYQPTNNIQIEIEKELVSIKSFLFSLKQENEVLKKQTASNQLIIQFLKTEIKESQATIYDMREEIINIHLKLEKSLKDDMFLSYIN